MKRVTFMTLAITVALVAIAGSIGSLATAGASETELTWTVWCSVNEDHCKSPHAPGSLTLDLSLIAGQKALILSSLGTLECKESLAEAKEVGKEQGPAVAAAVTKITFTGCSLGETACTVEVTGPEWYLLLLNATSEYHLILEPIPNVNFSCGFIKCVFGAKEGASVVLLTIEKLVADTDAVIPGQVFARKSGALCPETATLDAKYLIKCVKPAGTSVNCWPAMLKEGF